MMEKEILSSQEAAQLLKMNINTVEKMAASKKIPAVNIEGLWQYKNQDLQRWLRLQSCRQPEE